MMQARSQLAPSQRLDAIALCPGTLVEVAYSPEQARIWGLQRIFTPPVISC